MKKEFTLYKKWFSGYKEKSIFKYISSIHAKHIFDELERNIKKEYTILEIGCGNGYTASILRNYCFRIHALDIDNELIIDAAEKYSKIEFIQVDLNNNILPFEDHKFDLIISVSVFQYIHWKALLPEFKRVLKPESKIFLFENLSNNPFVKIYRKYRPKIENEFLIPQKHLSIEDVECLKCEFNIVSEKYFHFFSPLIIGLEKFNLNIKLMTLITSIIKKTDDLLFKFQPWLKRHAWNILIVLQKK